MSGLLLSDDLIFTSRIAGVAKDLGLTIRTARGVKDLERLAQTEMPVCLIVDLHHPELKIEDVVCRFKKAGTRIVGYGSHVAVEVLKNARDAGCDVVWPRSKFVEELANALPEWLGRARI